MGKIKVETLRVGQHVVVKGSFGTAAPEEAIVLHIEPVEIKRGTPGIAYLFAKGYGTPQQDTIHWCYDHQIVQELDKFTKVEKQDENEEE